MPTLGELIATKIMQGKYKIILRERVLDPLNIPLTIVRAFLLHIWHLFFHIRKFALLFRVLGFPWRLGQPESLVKETWSWSLLNNRWKVAPPSEHCRLERSWELKNFSGLRSLRFYRSLAWLTNEHIPRQRQLDAWRSDRHLWHRLSTVQEGNSVQGDLRGEELDSEE